MQTTIDNEQLANELDANVNELLTLNSKLAKQRAGEVSRVVGVTMAPSKRSGVNVCKHATPGCIRACVLWFAGRTVMPKNRRAAINRTLLWAYAPQLFYSRLRCELSRQQRNATRDNASLYVRLNVASDIYHGDELLESYPKITFYDYTKDNERATKNALGLHPENYHLTYSVSERSSFDDVRRVIEFGGNVAVVFDAVYTPQFKRFGYLPERVTFTDGKRKLSVDVVDGDEYDARTPHNDGRGVCVGLRLKGTNAAREAARLTGFARDCSRGSEYTDTLQRKGSAIVRLE